jgi:hypothetical protein
VVEVDICNQRHGHTRLDPLERIGGFHIGYGQPHNVTPGFGELLDLPNGGSHVSGIGVRHGLDGNGCISAHRNGSNVDLSCFLSRMTGHNQQNSDAALSRIILECKGMGERE